MPAPSEEVQPPRGGFDPIRTVRGAIRNSPWFVMATMIHVILVAVLSFFYVEHERAKALEGGGALAVAAKRFEEPIVEKIEEPGLPPLEAIPKLVDRNLDPTQPPKDIFLPTGTPLPPEEVFSDATENAPRGDPTAPPNLPRGPTTGGTPIGVGTVGERGPGVPSPYTSRFRRTPFGKPGGGRQATDRVGGSDLPTEPVLHGALEWLKKHQDPEGRWDSDGFSKNCKGTVCDGPGEGLHDIGVTGLALLAFLGDGNTLT
ncbi:MAG TPA: hypothetical protein VFI25_19460, partial [Planctomycetota bacterium]|nr:hypothetical protein [Planctomycetota bacterium]